MKTLGLIVRVSRVGKREGERFQSPDDQVKIAAAYAQGQGYDVQVFDADAQNGGVSGATPFADRPGLGAAMEAAEAGKIAGFVVAAQDRLVREDAEKGVTLRGFQRWCRERDLVLLVQDSPQAEVVDPDADELEGNEEWGVAGRTLADSIYRREMRKRWRRARMNAIQRGAYCGPTPAGYDRDENGRLHPNQYAPAIRRAFEIRAGQGSWSKVAAHLTEAGVATSRGNTRWSLKAAEKALRNEAYLGVARSGPYRNEEAHEPIVPRALWKKVQNRRETRAVNRGAREARLLSGMLVCGSCGHRLTYDAVKRGEKVYGYFRCRNTGACEKHAGISERKAESAISLILDDALTALPEPTQEGEIQRLRDRAADMRAKITETAADVDLPLDAVKARTAALQAALAEVEAALDAADTGALELPAGSPQEWWPQAREGGEFYRRILRTAVGQMVVQDGRVDRSQAAA